MAQANYVYKNDFFVVQKLDSVGSWQTMKSNYELSPEGINKLLTVI